MAARPVKLDESCLVKKDQKAPCTHISPHLSYYSRGQAIHLDSQPCFPSEAWCHFLGDPSIYFLQATLFMGNASDKEAVTDSHFSWVGEEFNVPFIPITNGCIIINGLQGKPNE